jgi:hypothetical protein
MQRRSPDGKVCEMTEDKRYPMAPQAARAPGSTPAQEQAPGSGHAPATSRVYLHIGEPKTGTTFLQQVMWSNRAELAAQGVVLPGHHPQDHYRASQDLRGMVKLASDPAGSWTGEWEILASQAKGAKTAVISHELFSAADEAQAERAVASLQPAAVHVVLTVRDMGSLLPAEWQETVKHRNAREWQDWLGDVIDRESVDTDRRQWWFWKVHDTLAIAGLWSRFVPADRVHVIIMPPPGASRTLLWERFASLLGVDPASVDTSRARPNVSLGLPEIEFLRRLNLALPAEIPDWFYMWNVKEAVAHQFGPGRQGARLALPADRAAWAAEQADLLIGGLASSKYDVVGDLDELRPRPVTEPAVDPHAQPAEQVLDAAVRAAAALVADQYRRAHPAAKPQLPRGLAGRLEAMVASSPRLKRTVRELSSRYPAVRKLRILAWRTMERTRARKGA